MYEPIQKIRFPTGVRKDGLKNEQKIENFERILDIPNNIRLLSATNFRHRITFSVISNSCIHAHILIRPFHLCIRNFCRVQIILILQKMLIDMFEKLRAKQSSAATTLNHFKIWFSTNKQKRTNRSRKIEDNNKSIPSLW